MKQRLQLLVDPDVREALDTHGQRGHRSMGAMVNAAVRQYCQIKDVPMDKEQLTSFCQDQVEKQLNLVRGMWMTQIKGETVDAVCAEIASLYPDTLGRLDPEASGLADDLAAVQAERAAEESGSSWKV